MIKNSGQNEDRCFKSRAGARLRIRGQNKIIKVKKTGAGACLFCYT